MTRPIYLRKIIQIGAEDSPNVRWARKEIAEGRQPTNRILLGGVITWDTYCERLRLWDEVRQCISLKGRFWEGAELLLYPPQWLDLAEKLSLDRGFSSIANLRKTMGIDSAQGGDNTAWAVSCSNGLLDLVSMKTPNTAVIPKHTITLMTKWGISPEDVLLDRGGGGKEHADRLRELGYNVSTVSFGEATNPEVQAYKTYALGEEKIRQVERRRSFKNRRAEMYWITHLALQPSEDDSSSRFALPPGIVNRPRTDGGPSLRKQLAKVPFETDDEGVIFVRPKGKTSTSVKQDNKPTLVNLIGCSPDEMDAFVMSVYRLKHKPIEGFEISSMT